MINNLRGFNEKVFDLNILIATAETTTNIEGILKYNKEDKEKIDAKIIELINALGKIKKEINDEY